MLDKNGREAFSEITSETKNKIDIHRSKNEIALIDTKNNRSNLRTGKFAHNHWKFFSDFRKNRKNKTFSLVFSETLQIRFLQQKTDYSFRKDLTKDNCVPDFNLKYRLFYLAFVLLFPLMF
jgi:hypothetical protein